MKFSSFPILASFLLALFVLALTAPLHAAAKKPTAAPPPDPRKLIKSVDAGNSQVVIVYMRDKNTHTYKIDDMTQLMINGTKGKFGEIKTGMEVADYVERDNDTLDTLTLQGFGDLPKPKAPAKPGAKPPAKPKTPATT
ncbi:MAG: hypothetical protein WDO13_02210 [Verrucomicrobiota bacterium]